MIAGTDDTNPKYNMYLKSQGKIEAISWQHNFQL